MKIDLFRDDVRLRHEKDLHGNIHLALPLSWTVITLTLLLFTTIGSVFLATAQYTKSEIFAGSIVNRGSDQAHPGWVKAQILVPSKAIITISRDQPVRISLDAYPSRQFGTIDAQIDALSKSPIMMKAGRNGIEPYYSVMAHLKQDYFMSKGRRFDILPGMSCKAKIDVETQSMLYFLMKPLFEIIQD